MSRAANDLMRLRSLRTKPPRDQTITAIVSRTATELSQAQRRMGELVTLWEQLVPADLARQTSLISMSRGVLHVAVDSSSVMFQLDRVLRGGVTDSLRNAYRGSLSRIKLRLREPSAPVKAGRVR